MKRALIAAFVLPALACAADAVLPRGYVLSCETYSYRALLLAGKLDVMEVPALYQREGIPGISLNERYLKSRDNAYVDRFKAAVARAGRKLTCLVIDGTLTAADAGKRRQQIAHDEESLRIAHRLGIPLVRINVSSSADDRGDANAALEHVVASFREMLPLARKLKVRISIENHGGVSRTAVNILRIIRETDPQWVGALVDFGNFPEASRYDEIAALAPHAFGVHIKTLDDGARYDLDRVFGMLRAQNYKGALSIEFEGKGDPMEGVRKSRELVVRHWK